MIHDKYNRIIIEKLPKDIAKEVKQIADDTENFGDDELVEIYSENFNELFKVIETNYPEALKPKKKLVKSGKIKVVKKEEPKQKLFKKEESKKVLKKKSNIDCDDAIETLSEIEKKKEQAAKKRAEAPKKKVSTAAKEKQIKTITSVFKTKAFKADKKQAQSFAKDLVAVYKKHGLATIAEQLQKDIDELIQTKYK